MVIEIGGKKPGYSQLYLKIPIREKQDKNFFKRLIEGSTDIYQYVPITNYVEKNDSLIIDKYIDEGLIEKQSYSIAQLNGNFPPNTFKVERIHYWLGTDKYGRDILSRLLIGVRVSLAVGLVTVIISLSIGVLLGAIAGYFRGWVDDAVMWVIKLKKLSIMRISGP